MAEVVSPCGLMADDRFCGRVCGFYLVVEGSIVGRGAGRNYPLEHDQNQASRTSLLA